MSTLKIIATPVSIMLGMITQNYEDIALHLANCGVEYGLMSDCLVSSFPLAARNSYEAHEPSIFVAAGIKTLQ